jgi:transcriptional regulator with GAF, ATPase, and Fis domain
LIKVNCAALPAQLIESELFGHEKGSFTGAFEQRIGKFELANRGTIFLDEIGELPLELQAKLLRVLQEKEIERLGGRKTLSLDVRIIAATNRDLAREVANGKFRSDLYYRLHVFPVTLPPLRERKEDIALLAVHFANKYAKKLGKDIKSIANASVQQLLTYEWPGNIREMEFLIERAVILARTTTLELSPLPEQKPGKISLQQFGMKSLQEAEKDHILEALRRTKGKVRGPGRAAELLRINASTLVTRMEKMGIKARRKYGE